MIRTVLLWLVPPVMGAIIGYVTNAIAIKMLFRPLKEYRVFGIRVPFTPGILPRERHRLAANIGAMVERELFTPEILRNRLRGEGVRHNLSASISEYTEKILNTPVGELVPSKKEAGELSAISRFITLSLKSFIYSPSFETVMGKISGEVITRFDSKSLRDILGDDNTQKLEAELSRIVYSSMKKSASHITDHVMPVVEKAYASTTVSLINFLMREEIHSELEVHGRTFLTNAILKLNAIQRFFISAGQYDKTIHDKMPEIIDDLINQLESLLTDKNTKKRFIAFLRTSIRKILSDESSAVQVSGFVMGLVSTYIDEPIVDIFKRLSKKDIGEAGYSLINYIRNHGGDTLELRLGHAIDSFLTKYQDVNLSGIFSLMPEQKQKIDSFISEKILEIADERIGSLLASIDVKAMVTERIDTLDMIKVEGIVLDVMDNQLKWINIFGGILGGLIGLFQAVFGWILR